MQQQLPGHYTHFNAMFFSLEHSFPMINLRVKDRWAPMPGSNQSSQPGVQSRMFRVLNWMGVKEAPFLRGWLLFQIALGWTLATLFVAGLSGIVKSN
jgi:hypothetical protein